MKHRFKIIDAGEVFVHMRCEHCSVLCMMPRGKVYHCMVRNSVILKQFWIDNLNAYWAMPPRMRPCPGSS